MSENNNAKPIQTQQKTTKNNILQDTETYQPEPSHLKGKWQSGEGGISTSSITAGDFEQNNQVETDTWYEGEDVKTIYNSYSKGVESHSYSTSSILSDITLQADFSGDKTILSIAATPTYIYVTAEVDPSLIEQYDHSGSFVQSKDFGGDYPDNEMWSYGEKVYIRKFNDLYRFNSTGFPDLDYFDDTTYYDVVLSSSAIAPIDPIGEREQSYYLASAKIDQATGYFWFYSGANEMKSWDFDTDTIIDTVPIDISSIGCTQEPTLDYYDHAMLYNQPGVEEFYFPIKTMTVHQDYAEWENTTEPDNWYERGNPNLDGNGNPLKYTYSDAPLSWDAIDETAYGGINWTCDPLSTDTTYIDWTESDVDVFPYEFMAFDVYNGDVYSYMSRPWLAEFYIYEAGSTGTRSNYYGWDGDSSSWSFVPHDPSEGFNADPLEAIGYFGPYLTKTVPDGGGGYTTSLVDKTSISNDAPHGLVHDGTDLYEYAPTSSVMDKHSTSTLADIGDINNPMQSSVDWFFFSEIGSDLLMGSPSIGGIQIQTKDLNDPTSILSVVNRGYMDAFVYDRHNNQSYYGGYDGAGDYRIGKYAGVVDTPSTDVYVDNGQTGTMGEVTAIAVDRFGIIYVLDNSSDTIFVIDGCTGGCNNLGSATAFTDIEQITLSGANYIDVEVSEYGETIYILDATNNQIDVYDTVNDVFDTSFGNQISSTPTDMLMDEYGAIYVSDSNEAVYSFDYSNTFIQKSDLSENVRNIDSLSKVGNVFYTIDNVNSELAFLDLVNYKWIFLGYESHPNTNYLYSIIRDDSNNPYYISNVDGIIYKYVDGDVNTITETGTIGALNDGDIYQINSDMASYYRNELSIDFQLFDIAIIDNVTATLSIYLEWSSGTQILQFMDLAIASIADSFGPDELKITLNVLLYSDTVFLVGLINSPSGDVYYNVIQLSTDGSDFTRLEVRLDAVEAWSPTDSLNALSKFRYTSSNTITHEIAIDVYDYRVPLKIYAPIHWNLTTVSPNIVFAWNPNGQYWSVNNTIPTTYIFRFLSGDGWGVDYTHKPQYVALSSITNSFLNSPSFESSQLDWDVGDDPFPSLTRNATLRSQGAFSLRAVDSSPSTSYRLQLDLPLGQYYFSYDYYVESWNDVGTFKLEANNDVNLIYSHDLSIQNRWVKQFHFVEVTSSVDSIEFEFGTLAESVVFFDNIKLWVANPNLESVNYNKYQISSQIISWDGYKNPTVPNIQAYTELREHTNTIEQNNITRTNTLIHSNDIYTDDNGIISYYYTGEINREQYELRTYVAESWWGTPYTFDDMIDPVNYDEESSLNYNKTTGVLTIERVDNKDIDFLWTGTHSTNLDLSSVDYAFLEERLNDSSVYHTFNMFMDDGNTQVITRSNDFADTSAFETMLWNIREDTIVFEDGFDYSDFDEIRFYWSTNPLKHEIKDLHFIQAQKSYFTPVAAGYDKHEYSSYGLADNIDDYYDFETQENLPNTGGYVLQYNDFGYVNITSNTATNYWYSYDTTTLSDSYSVSTRFNIDSTGGDTWFGLGFYDPATLSTSDDYFMFRADTTQTIFRVGGIETNPVYQISTDTWYTLQIDVLDEYVRVYLNNELVAQRINTNSLTNPVFGLFGYGSDVDVDHVFIKDHRNHRIIEGDNGIYSASTNNSLVYAIISDGQYIGWIEDLNYVPKNNSVGDHNLTLVPIYDSTVSSKPLVPNYMSKLEYLYSVENAPVFDPKPIGDDWSMGQTVRVLSTQFGIDTQVRSYYQYATDAIRKHIFKIVPAEGGEYTFYLPDEWSNVSIYPSASVSWSGGSNTFTLSDTYAGIEYSIYAWSGVGYGYSYDRQAQILAINDETDTFLANPSFEFTTQDTIKRIYDAGSDLSYSLSFSDTYVFDGFASLAYEYEEDDSLEFEVAPGEYYVQFAYYPKTILGSFELATYDGSAWSNQVIADTGTDLNRWHIYQGFVNIGNADVNDVNFKWEGGTSSADVIYLDDLQFWQANGELIRKAYSENTITGQMRYWDGYDDVVAKGVETQIEIGTRTDQTAMKTATVFSDENGMVEMSLDVNLNPEEHYISIWSYDSHFNIETWSRSDWYDGTWSTPAGTTSITLTKKQSYLSMVFESDGSSETIARLQSVNNYIDADWLMLDIQFNESETYRTGYQHYAYDVSTNQLTFDNDDYLTTGTSRTKYVYDRDNDWVIDAGFDYTITNSYWFAVSDTSVDFFEIKIYDIVFGSAQKSYFTPLPAGTDSYSYDNSGLQNNVKNYLDFSEGNQEDISATGSTAVLENGYYQIYNASTSYMTYQANDRDFSIDADLYNYAIIRLYTNDSLDYVQLKDDPSGAQIGIKNVVGSGWHTFVYDLSVDSDWAGIEDSFSIVIGRTNTSAWYTAKLDYIYFTDSWDQGHAWEFNEYEFVSGTSQIYDEFTSYVSAGIIIENGYLTAEISSGGTRGVQSRASSFTSDTSFDASKVSISMYAETPSQWRVLFYSDTNAVIYNEYVDLTTTETVYNLVSDMEDVNRVAIYQTDTFANKIYINYIRASVEQTPNLDLDPNSGIATFLDNSDSITDSYKVWINGTEYGVYNEGTAFTIPNRDKYFYEFSYVNTGVASSQSPSTIYSKTYQPSYPNSLTIASYSIDVAAGQFYTTIETHWGNQTIRVEETYDGNTAWLGTGVAEGNSVWSFDGDKEGLHEFSVYIYNGLQVWKTLNTSITVATSAFQVNIQSHTVNDETISTYVTSTMSYTYEIYLNDTLDGTGSGSADGTSIISNRATDAGYYEYAIRFYNDTTNSVAWFNTSYSVSRTPPATQPPSYFGDWYQGESVTVDVDSTLYHVRSAYTYVNEYTKQHSLWVTFDEGVDYATIYFPEHWGNITLGHDETPIFTSGNNYAYEKPYGLVDYVWTGYSGAGYGGVDSYKRQKQVLAIDDVTGDYLQSPSFESGSIEDWNEFAGFEADIFETDTSIVSDGSYSAYVNDSNSGEIYLDSSKMNFRPGGFYFSLDIYMITEGGSFQLSYLSDTGAVKLENIPNFETNRWITLFHYVPEWKISDSRILYFFWSSASEFYIDNVEIFQANGEVINEGYSQNTIQGQMRSWDGYKNPVVSGVETQIEVGTRTDQQEMKTATVYSDENGIVEMDLDANLNPEEHYISIKTLDSAFSKDVHNNLLSTVSTVNFYHSPSNGVATDLGDGDWKIELDRDTATLAFEFVIPSEYQFDIVPSLHQSVVFSIRSNISDSITQILFRGGDYVEYDTADCSISTTESECQQDYLTEIGSGSTSWTGIWFYYTANDPITFWISDFRIVQSQKSYFTPIPSSTHSYSYEQNGLQGDIPNYYDFSEGVLEYEGGYASISQGVTNNGEMYFHPTTSGSIFGLRFYVDYFDWSTQDVVVRLKHNSTQEYYFKLYTHSPSYGLSLNSESVNNDSSYQTLVFDGSDFSDSLGQLDDLAFVFMALPKSGTSEISDFITLDHVFVVDSWDQGHAWELEEPKSEVTNDWIYTDMFCLGATCSVSSGEATATVTTDFDGFQFNFEGDLTAYDTVEFVIQSDDISTLRLNFYEGASFKQGTNIGVSASYQRYAVSITTGSSANRIYLYTSTIGDFGAFNLKYMRLIDTSQSPDLEVDTSTGLSYFADNDNNRTETYRTWINGSYYGEYSEGTKFYVPNQQYVSYDLSFTMIDDGYNNYVKTLSSIYQKTYINTPPNSMIVSSYSIDSGSGIFYAFIETVWGNQTVRVRETTDEGSIWLGSAVAEGNSSWFFTNDVGQHNFTIYVYNGAEVWRTFETSVTISSSAADMYIRYLDGIGNNIPFETFTAYYRTDNTGEYIALGQPTLHFDNINIPTNIYINDSFGQELYNQTVSYSSFLDISINSHEVLYSNHVNQTLLLKFKLPSLPWDDAIGRWIAEGGFRTLEFFNGTYDVRIYGEDGVTLLQTTTIDVDDDKSVTLEEEADLLLYGYTWKKEDGKIFLTFSTNYDDTIVSVYDNSAFIANFSEGDAISWSIATGVNSSQVVLTFANNITKFIAIEEQSILRAFVYPISPEDYTILVSDIGWIESDDHVNITVTTNQFDSLIDIYHDDTLTFAGSSADEFKINKKTTAGDHNISVIVAWTNSTGHTFRHFYIIGYWIDSYYVAAMEVIPASPGLKVLENQIDMSSFNVYVDDTFVFPSASDPFEERDTEGINRSLIEDGILWVRNTAFNLSLKIADKWDYPIWEGLIDLRDFEYRVIELPIAKISIENVDTDKDYSFEMYYWNDTAEVYELGPQIFLPASSTSEAIWVTSNVYQVTIYDVVTRDVLRYGKEVPAPFQTKNEQLSGYEIFVPQTVLRGKAGTKVGLQLASEGTTGDPVVEGEEVDGDIFQQISDFITNNLLAVGVIFGVLVLVLIIFIQQLQKKKEEDEKIDVTVVESKEKTNTGEKSKNGLKNDQSDDKNVGTQKSSSSEKKQKKTDNGVKSSTNGKPTSDGNGTKVERKDGTIILSYGKNSKKRKKEGRKSSYTPTWMKKY